MADRPEPPDARPSGTTLGRAFLIRPTPFNEDLIAAVRVCASVHGDGPLPAIPLLFDSALGQVRGRFRFDTEGPISIRVNLALTHPAFAVVHEIGPFLDFSGIGKPNVFASETAEEMSPWRESVRRSRRYDELRRAIAAVSTRRTAWEPEVYAGFLTIPEL